jgi:hypothetical protein
LQTDEKKGRVSLTMRKPQQSKEHVQ